jgi:hypothetical protein
MAQRAGEKSWEAAISSGRWWNLFPKPGFDISVFCNVSMSNRDFFMTALYLEALVAIAASLSVLTAGAWVVQQPTRNSGWGDTIWTFRPAWPASEAPRPMPGNGVIAIAGCAPARSSRSRRRHDRGPGRVSADWGPVFAKHRA